MGIEPTLSAWEAEVLPLNYARVSMNCSRHKCPLPWLLVGQDESQACKLSQSKPKIEIKNPL